MGWIISISATETLLLIAIIWYFSSKKYEKYLEGLKKEAKNAGYAAGYSDGYTEGFEIGYNRLSWDAEIFHIVNDEKKG